MATSAHCRTEALGFHISVGQCTTTVDHLIPQQMENYITSEKTVTLAAEQPPLASTHAQDWTRSDGIDLNSQLWLENTFLHLFLVVFAEGFC